MKLNKLLPRYESSSDVAANATSTGNNAINSFDPTTTASTQQASLGSSGLGGLLSGETSDYVKRYQAAVAANPTVTDLYNTANQTYNVNNLASTATNLSNRLTNVVPNAYKGAKGFDIGSGDINNGISNATAYLTPQSNAATNNYNTAAELASKYVTAGQAQNSQNLLAIQSEGTLLAQQEAAQATGWNQTLQNEYDALIAKMNAGVTLSASEMARANTLAQTEEAYNQAVYTANAANAYQTIPAASTLYNTVTGATYTQ